MKQEEKALRVGLTALLCAMIFRLWGMGIPDRILSCVADPDVAAFAIYLETGRNVRFSPSHENFSPDFRESPPAAPDRDSLRQDLRMENIEILNTSGRNADTESLLMQPLQWNLRREEPTVLILHTHSTESYTRAGEAYQEVSAWRTLDKSYNMLSVGQRVAQRLTQAGIAVIQDRDFHDYPSYNGSYGDARKSMERYLEQYPGICLVLDLHRDAVDMGWGQLRPVCQTVDGDCAQMMIVLGTNYEGYTENLALALKLHAVLEGNTPGIMRPMQVRPQRFNQDLSKGALLIEMGAAGNTHSEAILAADRLAAAIIALANGTD